MLLQNASTYATVVHMSTTRITVFKPFTGEPFDLADSDYWDTDDLEPCVICGELTEPRQLVTLTPPHVCAICMDEEAQRHEPIRAREVA